MRNKLLLALSSLLTVLTGLAFVNNAVIIARWWMAFAAAAGDPAKIPENVGGCLPWLDWSAVDYSAVTTFIPFLGFVCITRGLVRIIRRRPADPECFPFFASSDQLNVALGLFGTLWGIIVIGYFKMDAVSMSDLMMCLHTALFSTLAAVVWVFMVDHPLIRPFMRRLLERENLTLGGDKGLAELMADLRSSAKGLSTTWQDERETLAHFRETLTATGETLTRFSRSCEGAGESVATKLTASVDALATHLRQSGDALASHLNQAGDALSEHLRQVGDRFDERQKAYDAALSGRVDAIEKREADAVALLKELATVIASLQTEQRSLTEALANARRENAATAAKLTQVQTERSELDGALKTARREAEDSSRRADRAEGLLAKIKSAFSDSSGGGR